GPQEVRAGRVHAGGPDSVGLLAAVVGIGGRGALAAQSPMPRMCHTKSFDRLGYHPIMTRQFVVCLKDDSRSLQDFVSSDSLRFTTGVEAEKSHGGSNAPGSDPSTARCPPDLQARTTKPFRPGMFMNGVPFMACARNVPCPCPSRQ